MHYIYDLSKLAIKRHTGILIIFPHPDDEVAFTAGFMQKAHLCGADIRLIILTKGEASTLMYGVSAIESLSNVRSLEFESSSKILGVTNKCLYALPDGKLEQNQDTLKDTVHKELNAFKPDIVITFEPLGVYGHPDHVILSKVITDLHKESNSFKLLYATVDPNNFHFDSSIYMAKDPSSVKPLSPDFALTLSLKETFIKYKALRSHKSQFKFSAFEILRWWRSGLLNKEFFTWVD